MRKRKTVAQQHQQEDRLLMATVGLEAHLINLSREIKAGEKDKLAEFQEMVRYAPPEMASKLLDRI